MPITERELFQLCYKVFTHLAIIYNRTRINLASYYHNHKLNIQLGCKEYANELLITVGTYSSNDVHVKNGFKWRQNRRHRHHP